MTEIREPNFGIDLPGEWERLETDEPGTSVFREKTGDARLSVMLLAVRPMFAIADQRRLLEDYMSHRAKFEEGQTPTLQQSDLVSSEQVGGFEGEWSGKDFQSERRTRHHVVLVDGMLADFLYETDCADEAAFEEQADAVLQTATVSPD